MTGSSLGFFSKLGITLIILLVSAGLAYFVTSISVDVGEDIKAEEGAENTTGAGAASSSQGQEDAKAEEEEPVVDEDLPALIFLSVGRVKDKLVLATYSPVEDWDQTDNAIKIHHKLLVRACNGKMEAGDRELMNWQNPCKIGYVLDAHSEYLACVVTTTPEYPKNIAFNLLQEFLKSMKENSDAKTAGKLGLTEALSSRMSELLAKYENPQKSTVYGQALGKMAGVKAQMQDNVHQVQDTGKGLNALAKSSANMDNMAKVFNKTTETAKWKYLLDRYKQNIVFGIGLFDFVVLFLLWKFG